MYSDVALTTNVNASVQLLFREIFFESISTVHFLGYQMVKRQRQFSFTARTKINHQSMLPMT